MAIQNITRPLFKQKVYSIVIFIHNLLQFLMHFHYCKICFIWLAGHTGIPGKERTYFLVRTIPISAQHCHYFSHPPFASFRSQHSQIQSNHFKSALFSTLLTSKFNPLSLLNLGSPLSRTYHVNLLYQSVFFDLITTFSQRTSLDSYRKFSHIVHFTLKLTQWPPLIIFFNTLLFNLWSGNLSKFWLWLELSNLCLSQHSSQFRTS